MMTAKKNLPSVRNKVDKRFRDVASSCFTKSKLIITQNQQNSMTIKTIKDFFNKKIQKFQQNILRISKIQWPSKLLNIVLTKKL